MCIFCAFFFFKQKTAYEMRISDWSSDVCSSDLVIDPVHHRDREDIVHRKLALEAGLRPLLQERAEHPRRDAAFDQIGVLGREAEIGRASCRERVCQYV